MQSHAFQQGEIAAIEPPSLVTGTNLLAGVSPPPSVTMFGWKLQFRGPETHPLGSCVSSNVTHFHVEVFRQNSRGRWDYILNVHLGAYRSSGRRCFVLYNNTRPYVCWKVCSPTWNQLKQMFVWILIAAAVIAGVVLAAWIISAILGGCYSCLASPVAALVAMGVIAAGICPRCPTTRWSRPCSATLRTAAQLGAVGRLTHCNQGAVSYACLPYPAQNRTS